MGCLRAACGLCLLVLRCAVAVVFASSLWSCQTMAKFSFDVALVKLHHGAGHAKALGAEGMDAAVAGLALTRLDLRPSVFSSRGVFPFAAGLK